MEVAIGTERRFAASPKFGSDRREAEYGEDRRRVELARMTPEQTSHEVMGVKRIVSERQWQILQFLHCAKIDADSGWCFESVSCKLHGRLQR